MNPATQKDRQGHGREHRKKRLCREFCDPGNAGRKVPSLRSRSKLARPHIWRLIIWSVPWNTFVQFCPVFPGRAALTGSSLFGHRHPSRSHLSLRAAAVNAVVQPSHHAASDGPIVFGLARRWLALCAVPFLVAACASSASFPAGPVRSPDPRPFNVTIYSLGTSNGPDLPVNVTGVISDHGFVRLDYSRDRPSDDLISLSRGTIVIRRSAGATGMQWLNSATCVSSLYRMATFSVLGGTESYAGIRGSGNVRVVSVTRTPLCSPSVKVSFRPQTVVIIGGSFSLG